MSYANGDQYEGQWSHDKMYGEGIYNDKANGITIKGTFVGQEPYKKCSVTHSNGKTKEVDFQQE